MMAAGQCRRLRQATLGTKKKGLGVSTTSLRSAPEESSAPVARWRRRRHSSSRWRAGKRKREEKTGKGLRAEGKVNGGG